MHFTGIPFWLFGALALGIAALFALLQFLRIRPRRQMVITTLFWRQALEETKASSLFDRFRHPWTYLLLLLAALALLLALAAPVLRSSDARHRVVALEAGLAMSNDDDRFERAMALVRAEAASLGEDRIAVIAADPQPRLLKHFDENLADLETRLAGLSPSAAPVVRNELLKTAASLLRGRSDGDVALVTAQPTQVADKSVRVLPAAGATANAFIPSAIFVPDAADLTQGSFHCQVGFVGIKSETFTLSVKRDDAVLLEESLEFQPGDLKELSVPEIAADGGVLTVSLIGPGRNGADGDLAFRLPSRRSISIMPQDGFELPPILTALIDSMPEVSVASAESAGAANLRLGPSGSDAEIWIAQSDAAGEWLPVQTAGHRLLAGLAFEDALCKAPGAGLKTGTPLLRVAGAPLASLDEEAGRLIVSSAFLDVEASVVRRTAYPVFWASLLHHLADWTAVPLVLSPELANRSTDVDDAAIPLQAGMNGLSFTEGEAATPARTSGFAWSGWQLLLVVALALMLVEAVLHLRGRIT